jgi:hypothetical protein
MAEGMLGGVLWQEAEKPLSYRRARIADAEAFASAIAAKLAGTAERHG